MPPNLKVIPGGNSRSTAPANFAAFKTALEGGASSDQLAEMAAAALHNKSSIPTAKAVEDLKPVEPTEATCENAVKEKEVYALAKEMKDAVKNYIDGLLKKHRETKDHCFSGETGLLATFNCTEEYVEGNNWEVVHEYGPEGEYCGDDYISDGALWTTQETNCRVNYEKIADILAEICAKSMSSGKSDPSQITRALQLLRDEKVDDDHKTAVLEAFDCVNHGDNFNEIITITAHIPNGAKTLLERIGRSLFF